MAVTKSIKSALAKIAEQDASLAWSLGATVRTGIFCCYAPEPGAPIEWEL